VGLTSFSNLGACFFFPSVLLLDTGNVRKGTARIGKGPGLENGAGPRRDGLRPVNLFSPGAFPFLARLALQKTILLASPGSLAVLVSWESAGIRSS